jgi:hypothetical protein
MALAEKVYYRGEQLRNLPLEHLQVAYSEIFNALSYKLSASLFPNQRVLVLTVTDSHRKAFFLNGYKCWFVGRKGFALFANYLGELTPDELLREFARIAHPQLVHSQSILQDDMIVTEMLPMVVLGLNASFLRVKGLYES